jgi:peptidoglycan hydrolase CwlO-like protein
MGKFIVFILVLAVVCMVIYNYVQTGELAIIPRKLSPREQEIRNLEKRIKQIERELSSLERQAREVGLAAPQAIEGALAGLKKEKEDLEGKLKELSDR